MKEFIEQLRRIMWNVYNAEIHDVDITDGIPFKLGAEETAPALYETAKREIRNSIWHDINEKPDMSKFVVFSDGKETMTPPLKDLLKDYPTLIGFANKKYGGGYNMWAYRDDLLPIDNDKK